MAEKVWKLLEILDHTSSFFLSKGLENPRLQAELLLADVLQLRRLDLYLHFERQLKESEVGLYRQYVKQRLAGEPVQYITGTAAFRHLELQVDRSVLVPRPETEVLVDVVLKLLGLRDSPWVLDMGCGSGAVGISVAQELLSARVLAVDISSKAVRVTKNNADRNHVAGRLHAVGGDLFDCLSLTAAASQFDLIISNPPYVATSEIANLPEEIRKEPPVALDGGADGLDFYRRLSHEAPQFMASRGALVLEVGDGQSQAVLQILRDCGRLENLTCCNDLTGVPRVISAQRT